MTRMACYVCGVVKLRRRLLPVPGRAWRWCAECERVQRERVEQANATAHQTAHEAFEKGFARGKDAGIAEERGRRWVGEGGKRDS